MAETTISGIYVALCICEPYFTVDGLYTTAISTDSIIPKVDTTLFVPILNTSNI